MDQIKIHYGHFKRTEGLESWILSEIQGMVAETRESLHAKFEIWVDKIKTSQNSRGIMYEIKLLISDDLKHRIFIHKKDMSVKKGFLRLKRVALKTLHKELDRAFDKRANLEPQINLNSTTTAVE